jgi:hypothetical protein
MRKLRIRKYSLIILTFVIIQYADTFGQKLPGLQTNAVEAPKNIKIDGKTSEWRGKLQAYNRNVEINYTVANNDKFLYIVVQAKEPDIIKKIIRGGIQISVNSKEKTLATNCKSVCYPLLNLQNENTLSAIISEINEIKDASTTSVLRSDSLLKAFNKILTAYSNELRVSTRYSIPDSTISIFNELQILAKGDYQYKQGLTYEFRIPYSFLGLDYQKGTKFFYNIKLNGRSSVATPRPKNDIVISARTVSMDSMSNLYMATDFWGEYIFK